MHTVIEVASPDSISLIDLGNEPCTLVNGARVSKCTLHVSDQIQVGGTRIVLEAVRGTNGEAVAAPPPAPPRTPPPPSSTPPTDEDEDEDEDEDFEDDFPDKSYLLGLSTLTENVGQQAIVGTREELLGNEDARPTDLLALRDEVRRSLDHDLKLWRKRRSAAHRAWFLPHVLEPVVLGVLVSLFFLLPSLGLPTELQARLQSILSVGVAIVGALSVAHRLIVDPDGKVRGYIGRLDRIITMVDGYKALLFLDDQITREKIEFVIKAAKVAHTVLRPDERDL